MDDLADQPKQTVAARRYRDWRFVAADTDQGFLWYLFYIRRPVGAYFRLSEARSKALHWYLQPKPWLIGTNPTRGKDFSLSAGNQSVAPDLSQLSPWELARAYAYLKYSTRTGGGAAPTGSCARRMWEFRRAIEDDTRFEDLPSAGLGSGVPFFPLWR